MFRKVLGVAYIAVLAVAIFVAGAFYAVWGIAADALEDFRS